ncbi:MAG: DUF4136 domain-containing protein [Bdellovibrionia bacterium]
MRKSSALFVLCLLTTSPALGLLGCSSTEVHTEKAANADLAQYQRFAWAPPHQQEQSNGLSGRKDTILDQKIKTAVDQDLSQKGYVQNPENADIHLAYSLRTRDQLQVQPGYMGPYGSSWSDGMGYDTASIQKEGSLVLDFIDAKTGNLLWRGVAVTDIKDTGVTQKQVQESVDKIMEKFPSRNAPVG